MTMRIGQLARRLGVAPSDITGFLSGKGIEAESGTNTRLDENTVTAVITHFAPGRLNEILRSETPETPEPVVVLSEATETIVETVEQSEAINPEPILEPVADAEQKPTDESVEVIRVSKVELQGLKVLGKIELPQPKKKEPPVEGAEGEQTGDQQTTQRPVRREYQKRSDQRREQKPWKNPVEAKRRREAEEAERKKQETAERQKEKRTNHYYSKVKSVPTKPVRRYEENTAEVEIETKQPPKGILGKFFRWLRS